MKRARGASNVVVITAGGDEEKDNRDGEEGEEGEEGELERSPESTVVVEEETDTCCAEGMELAVSASLCFFFFLLLRFSF